MRLSARLPPFLVEKRRRKARKRINCFQLARRSRLEREHKRFLRISKGTTSPVVSLIAPQFFALLQATSHAGVVGFLRELVSLTLDQNKVVCIDFRPTQKFYSDGTLLLLAEVERILSRQPNSLRCLLPKDKVARQVLSHLGLLKRMECRAEFPSKRPDVTNWAVLRGVMADATQGVGQTIDTIPRLTKVQASKLFRSVTEALTNVTQHAYTEPRMDGTGTPSDRGWWMFVREKDEELTVMFCDLGLGVPYTVPRSTKHAGWFAKRIAAVMNAMGDRNHKDGETIQVTVEEKRSRFQLEHRGNGFGNMLETISAAGAGRMTIFSNRGAYQFKLAGGNESHQAVNYTDSVFGTVVGWHIAVPSELA